MMDLRNLNFYELKSEKIFYEVGLGYYWKCIFILRKMCMLFVEYVYVCNYGFFLWLVIKKKLMNKNKYIGMRGFFFVLEGKINLVM